MQPDPHPWYMKLLGRTIYFAWKLFTLALITPFIIGGGFFLYSAYDPGVLYPKKSDLLEIKGRLSKFGGSTLVAEGNRNIHFWIKEYPHLFRAEDLLSSDALDFERNEKEGGELTLHIRKEKFDPRMPEETEVISLSSPHATYLDPKRLANALRGAGVPLGILLLMGGFSMLKSWFWGLLSALEDFLPKSLRKLRKSLERPGSIRFFYSNFYSRHTELFWMLVFLVLVVLPFLAYSNFSIANNLAVVSLLALYILAGFYLPNLLFKKNKWFRAAKKGDLDGIRSILNSGFDINRFDGDSEEDEGVTALHIAASNGHIKVVSFLLDSGADINLRNKQEGMTPLIVAISARQTDVAKALMERGADVGIKDDYKNSPLVYAVETGLEELACRLVEKGADIREADSDGGTVLQKARKFNLRKLEELLVRKGVRPTS